MEQVANPAKKKWELSRTLIWVSFVSCFLSAQYGCNVWILYSPSELMQDYYNVTSEGMGNSSQLFIIGISLALFPLGGIFGSLAVGYLVDRFGRKGALMITDVLSIISAVLMGCTSLVKAYRFSMFARLYVGMCTGIISSVVPLYLGEISPRSVRGAVIILSQLLFTIGILFIQMLSLNEVWGNLKGWPFLKSLPGILPLCQILLLPFFPESPRYLFIQRKDEESARQALKKLRERDDVEDEIEELRQEDLAEKAEKKMNPLKLLMTQSLRLQVSSVLVLMTGEQLTGANVAYYYTDRIYQAANVETHNVRLISIGSSAFLTFAQMLGMYLVDAKGRKVVLLIGFGLCSIMCVLLTMTLEIQVTIPEFVYLSAFFVETFLFGHSFGPNAVPPVLVVELFLQSTRSSAFVISGFVQWLIHFLIGVTFLHVETIIGAYSFLIFWPMTVATCLYIFKIIPETKNRTFLDIRRLMAIKMAGKIQVKRQMGK
ncbi:solute carrier family 2, facilitated glucose transporter member 5-like [Rhineura floridana]|uniref:solute carrier family 2, facilitated glucose transporter member 5-like n=1 Tax=Rhineura floridana TaxID=261503 RepID=UPI002AC7FF32|nr:solute carrier family 2, facilitated glucose transporter member 5-like [Rhineura floridana]